MMNVAPSTSAVALPEMLVDGITPVAAYYALRGLAPGSSFLLESAPGAGHLARSSVIGLGAVAELRASPDGIAARFADGHRVDWRDDVLSAVRRFVHECTALYANVAGSPYVGAYCVASFGAAAFFEPRLAACYPDALLRLVVPAVVITFDHASHVAQVVMLEDRPQLREAVMAVLGTAAIAPLERSHAVGQASGMTSADRYQAIVTEAKEAINDGEVFQVVLSQTWQARISGDPFDAFRKLRSINPSPYMFYLDFDGAVVLGSSPEMLCKRIRLRPLAGTRPRPAEHHREREVEQELRSDPKERAEHVMLVDLGRNDVGRVSRYGSVEVTELMAVERYSHVMHLVSEVQGRIAPGRDALDLFAAAFPAGTVSGAPKVRALELIAHLERRSRGVYGGSIARLGFDGSLDACIVLRSAQVRDGVATLCAGAGIVADSVPELEERECRAKASAIAHALGVELS
jgi:anthranilate synthase component 1